MYSQNSTYLQAVCGKPLRVAKTLCFAFLLTMLCACQHQAVNQANAKLANVKQTPNIQKNSATHLPQAKPLTPEDITAAMQASNMAKIKQDKYLSAFLFSGFEETPSNTPEISQPNNPPSPTIENEPVVIEASHLVDVEVWSIILGQEKIALLAKAQKLGATQLPPSEEWHQWRMAMGSLETLNQDNAQKALERDSKKSIIFIAPPDFSKFKNGDHVIVEISSSGGVHVARYMK